MTEFKLGKIMTSNEMIIDTLDKIVGDLENLEYDIRNTMKAFQSELADIIDKVNDLSKEIRHE